MTWNLLILNRNEVRWGLVDGVLAAICIFECWFWILN